MFGRLLGIEDGYIVGTWVSSDAWVVSHKALTINERKKGYVKRDQRYDTEVHIELFCQKKDYMYSVETKLQHDERRYRKHLTNI